MSEQQAEQAEIEASEVEQEVEELDADDTGAQADEWTPPTREEWEAAQGKLKRANDQAKRLRERQRAAEAAKPAEGAPAGPTAEDVAQWQGRAVRSAARAALLERGADADMVSLALGQLRPSEIEFDRNDEPELEDWLDDIEERFPKLFVKGAPASAAPTVPRAGRVEQAPAARRPAPRQLSLGEQIIANSEAARRQMGRGR